jgi:hypothetical protein
MRKLLLVVPLLALLGLSVWFAAAAWMHIGGDEIPLYGYVAIAGGVLFSLLVGGGLMALVFYSNRHGYDHLSARHNYPPLTFDSTIIHILRVRTPTTLCISVHWY